MTALRVDPEVVTDLGISLLVMAEEVSHGDDAGLVRHLLGGPASGAALDDLLGNWRRERLLLARSLYDLGDAAVAAGGVYVETEVSITATLGGVQR